MKNCWKFFDAAAHEQLGDSPEFPAHGVRVKASPVREVVRDGAFFWKRDRRGGHHLRGEWRAARLVRANSLPCVDYLALGRTPEGNVIVTAALPDAESAADYWQREIVERGGSPEPFLTALSAFVRKMLASGLFHPDFHLGNLLYRKEFCDFTLVDVAGVRRAGFLDRRFRRYRMERILLECRRPLDDAALAGWIARCGIGHPEEFLQNGLLREARALDAEWPKRKRQILTAYPKFCERGDDGTLYALTPYRTRRPTAACEAVGGSPERLRALFLAHFHLDLAQLEHRNVVAWESGSGRLLLEPANARPIPAGRMERFAAVRRAARNAEHDAGLLDADAELLERM